MPHIFHYFSPFAFMPSPYFQAKLKVSRNNLMLTDLQYRFLMRFFPPESLKDTSTVYIGKSKLGILLGEEFFDRIAGKVVIDFGCGEGSEAIEMAQHGAKHVIGLDIREDVLATARIKAAAAGVQDRCTFTTRLEQPAEIVVSVDAFEHFEDPAAMLRIMDGLLQPKGEIIVSFGPTWYHPLGGHLFSVFPWAHLLLTEEALIRWRSTFKTDGATRFNEVAGGLNQMTIARFESIVAASPFQFSSFYLAPIRKIRILHNQLTREFTTAVVRCRLIKRT
jgi:SAM-dependent methyltransferase